MVGTWTPKNTLEEIRRISKKGTPKGQRRTESEIGETINPQPARTLSVGGVWKDKRGDMGRAVKTGWKDCTSEGGEYEGRAGGGLNQDQKKSLVDHLIKRGAGKGKSLGEEQLPEAQKKKKGGSSPCGRAPTRGAIPYYSKKNTK